jgi:hypothetical protein
MSTVAQAKDLEAQFHAGVLSKAEYRELLEDLGRTSAIEEAGTDLAKLTQIHQVLEGLKVAAGLI